LSPYAKEIETEIFAVFDKWRRRMKVAMVIGSVLGQFKDRNINLHEDDVAKVLYHLIDRGGFKTFGDIQKWRHSEIVPSEYL